MRAILTLAGKDLRNLLTSPLFYVIAGLCSMLWSSIFIRAFFTFAGRSQAFAQSGMEGGANIHQQVFLPHINIINLLFVFVVPALTMRLLAEEKRLRTYDLLLTSPISATDIAVGKFLAGWGAVALLAGISFLYPLSTGLVASFPMGPLISSYVGVLLVSGAYVAVGLFASSLTESILLSVILGLVFNLLLWFIAQAAGEGSSYASFFEYLSIGHHYVTLVLGAYKLNSLVFLLSLIGLFVFLTQRVVESSRWR